MKLFFILIIQFICCGAFVACKSQVPPDMAAAIAKKDSIAERILHYQRANGGWPQPGGNRIDYNKPLSKALVSELMDEKSKSDATIDDGATTTEIKTLVTAYKQTHNLHYLKAAEKGITYLLTAQNQAGGWGQFFPDTTGYHKHITFNDNAMINVMWVLKYTLEGTHDFETVSKDLIPKAKTALVRGIDCIIRTQFKQKGKLTAWCAQHDRNNLLPAKARTFELPSLSGSESVGILQFLMSIENPSADIKNAIRAAVVWLEAAKLPGIATQTITDASLPRGKDVVVVQDPTSVMWARFYDLETNQPFFCGRDGIKKNALAAIENERRVGYAWYGKWAAKLLDETYPKWLQKWGN